MKKLLVSLLSVAIASPLFAQKNHDFLWGVATAAYQVEGGYQVSHPDFFRKIKERLLQLAIKYEDENILAQIQDPVPTITSKAVW